MVAEAKWLLIDAEGLVLGRLAVEIARLIRGKHKATFTPHVNCGDKVVVVNADKVHLTAKKRKNKVYYWHTGYVGGIKQRTTEQILDGEHPERVLGKAVEGMIPGGTLKSEVLRNLHIYVGAAHCHEAQQPKPYDFAAANAKNSKRY
ncbi:MAG: 50S ribosomal protein L13 [Alphaproteobacteria bacterium]|nr:50S ribosomal protein L13 [Alphaproteobacteria bacterium]